MQTPSTYHLESYVSNSGNVITATAHVTLVKDGEKMSGETLKELSEGLLDKILENDDVERSMV